MLLEKTLATLAYIVTQYLSLVLAGLVLVVGAAVCLCEKVHTPSPWVVRKGACPCCGSALFGATPVYQHLPGLERIYPESPYLCLACDRIKIAALQRHYRADRVDE